MNILVTGGAGFIASAIVRQLVREQRGQVVNVDKLTYAADLSRLDECRHSANYHFVKADVNDQAVMRQLLADYQIGAVIHAAAETHVDRSIGSPEPFLHSNVAGTYALLEVLRSHLETLTETERETFRLVQISTDEVYGDLVGEEKAKESAPYRPSSPYAASKAAADHLVRAWSRTYGIPSLITHSANNYGPGQHPEKLIPKVIAQALARKPIPVFGAGNQVRDWIHVEDHARAVITVLDHGRLGESYNISTGDERVNLDLIRQLCDIIDRCVDSNSEAGVFQHQQLIEHVEDRPGHDMRYAMNTDRLTQLGWTPQIDFEQGLKATILSALNYT
ncbi:dTDP-glucose 4,6-dehydratase [Verrucomicrobiaceae bacterium 5K15]|uniref:dTDP-glucose 4,6-dehydratase n=1 Tax=Oceaniferula flava TaxID=2800421 RepID=A0AAE2SDV4_9BACT|nr:dTDP-glucose 4,6-dehydratase [Oceaniferula flavus]MBK1856563.1 dTDP-glucose 4,6-dehydratase [Oceaniferula flavus]MBM1137870.1 dTDP-glucose 4,6-dehydratase [Oceaniferula flavus]